MEILGRGKLKSSGGSSIDSGVFYFIAISLIVVLFGSLASIVAEDSQDLRTPLTLDYNSSFIATSTVPEVLAYSGEGISSYSVETQEITVQM